MIISHHSIIPLLPFSILCHVALDQVRAAVFLNTVAWGVMLPATPAMLIQVAGGNTVAAEYVLRYLGAIASVGTIRWQVRCDTFATVSLFAFPQHNFALLLHLAVSVTASGENPFLSSALSCGKGLTRFLPHNLIDFTNSAFIRITFFITGTGGMLDMPSVVASAMADR